MQQGGSPYGAPPQPPDLAQFSSPGAAPQPQTFGIPAHGQASQQQQQQQRLVAEAASPISMRPPPPDPGNSEELGSAAAGNFPDEEALNPVEEDDRGGGGGGGGSGNRWPREETLALLKIRSEMDAAFQNATLKGPLWEEVTRKLAELGYKRSAKKCREKFENVHKYYKRTKEGRAGRQDGKAYRFFNQLEALHAAANPAISAAAAASPAVAAPTATSVAQNLSPASAGFSITMSCAQRTPPPPISAITPPPISATNIGVSFSSSTFSSSASESDGGEDEGTSEEGRKRKRGSSGGGRSGTTPKMLAFFEGLMRQVMEQQEAMQQRFLEAIEKREQDRMIREEAWRRQEMARLAREHEVIAQERAAAASRDNAIIAFLQKITGQTITLPPQAAAAPPPQPPPPQQQQPLPPLQQQQPPQQPSSYTVRYNPPPSSLNIVPVAEPQEITGGGSVSLEPASSRWPKAEVHTLIKLRTELEPRYHETGPKGPLWEEISAGMRRLGYNRSSKRCKEKWENINKYFKKVKDSSKKRPVDAKTCPYFHQLDALYRSKLLGGGHRPQELEPSPNPNPNPNPNPIPQDRGDAAPTAAPSSESQQQHLVEAENRNNRDGNRNEGDFGDSTALDKPEGIARELMEQDGVHDGNNKMVDPDDNGDSIDQADDDDDGNDEDDEGGKMQYRIQFQKQNADGGGGGSTASGSFLTIVQ